MGVILDKQESGQHLRGASPAPGEHGTLFCLQFELKSFISRRQFKNALVATLLIGAAIGIGFWFFGGGSSTKTMNFSDVVAAARAGSVQTIEGNGQSLNVTMKQASTALHVAFRLKHGPRTDAA